MIEAPNQALAQMQQEALRLKAIIEAVEQQRNDVLLHEIQLKVSVKFLSERVQAQHVEIKKLGEQASKDAARITFLEKELADALPGEPPAAPTQAANGNGEHNGEAAPAT